MTTLAVVGSRVCNAAQFAAIMRHLDNRNPAPDQIVTGDAAGVDEASRFWAQVNVGPAEVHVADWSIGPKAGPVRNAALVASLVEKVAEGVRADLIAFYCRKPSPGTDDVVRQAKRAGLFPNVFDLSGVA